jgi:hypothetical protein
MFKVVPVFAIIICLFFATEALPQDPQNAFELIQNLEDFFLEIDPFQDVNVGTFDAKTGKFSGLKTIIIPAGNGVPKPLIITPTINAKAITLRLKFGIKNRENKEVYLQINGHRTGGLKDEFVVSINPSTTRNVSWRITGGNKTISDELDIKQNVFAALGGLELPLIPTGIVYDLPATLSPESKVTYTFTKTTSIGMRFSSSKKGTTATEESPDFMTGLTEFQEIVGKGITVAKVFSLDDKDKVAKVTKLAEKLNAALTALVGSATATNTEETVTAAEEYVQLKTLAHTVISPPRQGGQGKGDMLKFVRSPKFGWVTVNGKLRLTLLSHEGMGLVNINNAQAMKSFGWSEEVIAAVRKLDPFLGDQNAPLDKDRFQLLITLSDLTELKYKHTQEELRASKNSSSKLETTVIEKKSGLLGRLGLGVAKDEKLTVGIEFASEGSEANGNTLEIDLDLKLNPEKVFEIYYDTLFGMLAFREYTPTEDTSVLAGTAEGLDGKKMVKELVAVKINGTTHYSKTNGKGEFVLRGHSSMLGAPRLGAVSEKAKIQLKLTSGVTTK